MTEVPIKSVIVLIGNEDNLKSFSEILLPSSCKKVSKEDYTGGIANYCIADIEGLSKSVEWLTQKGWPEKIILLFNGFDPSAHIKKETIVIQNFSVLGESDFWERLEGKEKDVDILEDSFTNYIEHIFQIGAILDQINFSLQKHAFLTIEMIDSISKLGQFFSSLFYNGCIPNGIKITFSIYSSEKRFYLEADTKVQDFDSGYLFNYLKSNSTEYSESILIKSLLRSDESWINLTGEQLKIRLCYSPVNPLQIIHFRIDKMIQGIKNFSDSEGLTPESSGLLLDFSEELSDVNLISPGVAHKPRVNPDRRATIEDLVVKVVGHKESYSDHFDLEKIKKIIDEDPYINETFSEEELTKVRDISNDVESTVALARAKEDVFGQVVSSGKIEEEIIKVMDSLEEDDLPFLLAGKGEISLEDGDKVVVKEPDEVRVEEDVIVIGDEQESKEEVIKVLGGIQEKIKDQIVNIKGELKTKEDVEKFVIKAINEVDPKYERFGKNISKNIMSGLIGKKMDDLVYSKKSWQKMNEMIGSFKKKLEIKEKQITTLRETVDTLSNRDKELHPVFKKIVDDVEKDDPNKKENNDFEKIIKRKDQYIKKLENKLIDKQHSEIKIIGSDKNDIVESEIVLKRGQKETELYSDKDPIVEEKIDINLMAKELEEKKTEAKKMRNIGISMAKKLKDINQLMKDYKARNNELLIERNHLSKESHRLGLLERRAREQVADYEKKIILLKNKKVENKEGLDSKQNVRDQAMEMNYTRKIQKLENLNEKLSEGAKSLAKKLTRVQSDFQKLKMEKREVDQRLSRSESNLSRLREEIQKQIKARGKKAS